MRYMSQLAQARASHGAWICGSGHFSGLEYISPVGPMLPPMLLPMLLVLRSMAPAQPPNRKAGQSAF